MNLIVRNPVININYYYIFLNNIRISIIQQTQIVLITGKGVTKSISNGQQKLEIHF